MQEGSGHFKSTKYIYMKKLPGFGNVVVSSARAPHTLLYLMGTPVY